MHAILLFYLFQKKICIAVLIIIVLAIIVAIVVSQVA